MVHIMDEVRKGVCCFFTHAFNRDFLLIQNQLEADKKAVVHLIFPNHRNKGFGLCVDFLIGNFFQPAGHFLFRAFLRCPYTGFRTNLQSVDSSVTVLCD